MTAATLAGRGPRRARRPTALLLALSSVAQVAACSGPPPIPAPAERPDVARQPPSAMASSVPAPSALRVDPDLPFPAAPPVLVAVHEHNVYSAMRDALRPEAVVARIGPDLPARELARHDLGPTDLIACGGGLALAGVRAQGSQPVVVLLDADARATFTHLLPGTRGSLAFGPRLSCRGGGVEAVWVTGLAHDALLWARVEAGRPVRAASLDLPDPSYDVSMTADGSGVVVARAHGRSYAVEIGRIRDGVMEARADLPGIDGAVSTALGVGPDGLVLAFLRGGGLAAVRLDAGLALRGPVTPLLTGPLHAFRLYQGPAGALAVSWMDLAPSVGEGPGVGPQSVARLGSDGETLRLGPSIPVVPAGVRFLGGSFDGRELVLAHGTQAPTFSVLSP